VGNIHGKLTKKTSEKIVSKQKLVNIKKEENKGKIK